MLESTEFDNYICVSPPTDFTTNQLRQQAISAGIDAVTVLEADVDGVPVKDPKKYAIVSPGSMFVNTLAAAHAEAGDFQKAVSVQKEAIALVKAGEEKEDFESRLTLYQENTPHREQQ